MANDLSVRLLDRLPPAEAVRLARERAVVLPDDYYGSLQGLARSLAFSVSGISARDQLQGVLDGLIQAAEEGIPFEEWRKRTLAAGLLPLDLPRHRLENIFRTNAIGQYMRGRCQGLKRRQGTHPYLRYSAVMDGRERPAHGAMDGFVARADDPVWRTWMPPCGYQCRCDVIPLTQAQADRWIERDERRLAADPEAAQARILALTDGPDAGWDYSVCEEPTEGTRRALEEAQRRWSPDLGRGAAELRPDPAPPSPHFFTPDPDPDDMIDRGKKIVDELLTGGTLPDDRAQVPNMSMRGKPFAEFLDDPAARPIDKRTVVPIFGKALHDRLSELRSIGGALPDFGLSAGGRKMSGVADLEQAARRYPTSWVEATNKAGKLYPKRTKKRGRGWHAGNPHGSGYKIKPSRIVSWGDTEEILEEGDSAILTDGSTGTAVHEFGHRVQMVLPKLDEAFQALHRRRTAGETLQRLIDLTGNRGYKTEEVAKRDHYIDPYMGKEYRGGQALELLTMLFEAVLSAWDDPQGSRLFAALLDGDREALHLAVGLLAHYRP